MRVDVICALYINCMSNTMLIQYKHGMMDERFTKSILSAFKLSSSRMCLKLAAVLATYDSLHTSHIFYLSNILSETCCALLYIDIFLFVPISENSDRILGVKTAK